jgi:alpha-tubulin suppressor-like RCC1 family protein
MRSGILRGISVGACVAIAAGPVLSLPAYAAAGPGAAQAGRAGPLLAWGDNQFGELGVGNTDPVNGPVAVNPPHDLRVVSARATAFALAVTASGQVWAWGRGTSGELGNGAMKTRHRPVLVHLPKGVKVKMVRTGFKFAVAVTTDGRVLTWGDGASGDLGTGKCKPSDVPVFAALPPGAKVTQVAAGAVGVVALTSTGTVLTWGANSDGALGTGGTRKFSCKPVQAKLPKGAQVKGVAAGVDSRYAITTAGGLLAWGGGVLGTAKKASPLLPAPVMLPKGVKVIAASAGLMDSLALTSTGRVLAWGVNEAGELGNGTFNRSQVPVFVHLPTSVRIVAISSGREHCLALSKDGRVYAWGDDNAGQLGDGGNMPRDLPFKVPVPGKAIEIGSGNESFVSTAIVTKIID